MYWFVVGGLTPAEALRTVTMNPAIFLNKQKQLGTVDVGKLADLVLLDANPLEDISNTRKINAVVANGKLLTRKDLDKLLEEAKYKVKSSK
ncbi:MAG: amidohydrolase family protein [Chitinophagaceae bacterium]